MSAVVLLYRPELGRILKELKFCYPAEGAMWLEQMAYWCRKKMGYLMRDGRRFIYNAYDDWTKDQITTLSSWKFGKMIRQFRQWGWITTACFAHLKDEFVNPDEVPEEFHPYNTSTWVSLNEKVIEEVIGWNPFAQETNTPTGTNPPESLKLTPSNEIANATTGDCERNDAKLPRQRRSIYKENQNITKSIPRIDLKKNEESNQQGVVSTTQVEILTTTKQQEEVCQLIAESLGEAQNPAPTSLYSDVKIKEAQQCLAALNTKVEQQDRPQQGQLKSKPICIPDLDEETHEILWKHQEQLEKLNADLHAERIQKAIADNPQHLESAILAFIESSASGAKTQEAATGFLFNALRQGWKPRQSLSSASASVPVYTPHPSMLEEPKPSTLKELVQRKRRLWQVAPIMRPSITVWAEQTEGFVIGPDGPELAVEGALTLSPTEPVVEAPETPLTRPEATTSSASAPIPSDPEAKAPTLTPDSQTEAQKEAKASTLAASKTSQPVPADPPAASVPSPKDEPLKVGERVLWENCPVHCASWNPFTISKIIGGKAWLDVYEKPVPIKELKRAP